MNTVQDPDIVALYRKIHDNPEYFDVPNEMTFVKSPLHIAASEGRTRLALEILRLKPSLGKKLNLDGLSPLHLAMDNGHTDTVRRLINHDPDLIRVPGREGITLLHCAVEKEDIDLLINCLLRRPSSIYDLTVRDETVVHIAVRNKKIRAFEVLYGWVRKVDKSFVLRWKNEEGNTALHLAALITNQSKVIKSLIRYVNVNEKNLEGKTALDLLESENVEAREILMRAGAKEGSSLVDDDIATSCENYLKSNGTVKDHFIQFGAYLKYGLSGDMRNATLVVAVLIATASFQTILTPPFGISQIDTTPVSPNIISVHNATTSTNATSTNFYSNTKRRIADLILVYNIFTFGIAIGTCVVLTSNVVQALVLPYLLIFSMNCVALAYQTSPDSYRGAYVFPVVVVSCILLPLLMIIPWKMVLFKVASSGKKNYCDYDIDEMKFLIFRDPYLAQKNSASVLDR